MLNFVDIEYRINYNEKTKGGIKMRISMKKILLTMTLTIVTIISFAAMTCSAASAKLSKTSLVLTKGYAYTVSVNDYDGDVSWSSSDKNIATVSSSGKITAKSAGACYIYAEVGKESLKCTIKVKPCSLTVSSKKLNVNEGSSKYISLSTKNSKNVSVISNDTNVAKAEIVSWNKNKAKVKITGVNSGTTSVKIYFKEYTDIYKTVNVSVNDVINSNDDTSNKESNGVTTTKPTQVNGSNCVTTTKPTQANGSNCVTITTKPSQVYGSINEIISKLTQGYGSNCVTTTKPTQGNGSNSVITTKPTQGSGSNTTTTTKPTQGSGSNTTTTTKPTQGSGSNTIITTKPTQTSTSNGSYSNEVSEVLRLVNEERKAQGKSALVLDDKLSNLAEIRAKEINSVFSHTRPDGRQWHTVYSDNNYSYSFSAENIAKGYTDADSVMNGWMNSSGHRANILNDKATKIGIAFDSKTNAWVQLFAA